MNPKEQNNLPNQQSTATPATPRTYPAGKLMSDINPMVAVSPNAAPPAATPTPPPPTPYAQPPDTGKKPKKHHAGWKSLISTLLLLAIAPLIALSITAFALQSYQVDGASMETTLQDHDRLIVNKLPRTIARVTNNSYIPNRGDIIIFNQANLPNAYLGEEKQLIKRVIGLPGDRVVVRDSSITVYNKANPNGFNPDQASGYRIAETVTAGDVDVTLKDDEVFVCGDNRSNSEDSRYFGPIKADDIVGKLVLRLLPMNKAQRF